MASPQWAKRNEAARARGYKSYYDYRIHGFGSRPPDQPAFAGEDRERLRGHRSRADLAKQVEDGSFVTFNDAGRNAKGQIVWVELVVIDPEGREKIYRLSGPQLDKDTLRALVDSMEANGATFVFAHYILDDAQ